MPDQAVVSDPAVLVQGLMIFIVAGILMVLGALIAGSFIRPKLAHPEKGEAYECGEPAIGSSWVQFDLRFYVVALVFVIFDVEIALLYPWAVVYKSAGIAGLWDMLFFFGVLVVGFLYLWKSGYLDWVRSTTAQRHESVLTGRSNRRPAGLSGDSVLAGEMARPVSGSREYGVGATALGSALLATETDAKVTQ